MLPFCLSLSRRKEVSFMTEQQLTRPREQQAGHQDTAEIIFPFICCTPVQSSPVQEDSLPSSVCFSLPYLFLSLFFFFCLLNTDKRKIKIKRAADNSTGQVLGQPVCSCSAVCYSTGLHKQTGSASGILCSYSMCKHMYPLKYNQHICHKTRFKLYNIKEKGFL